jgi:hypothetical protein
MEGQGQRERTSSRRRQRRKAKSPRNKVVVEPVLIVARRPDSPLLKNGFHTAVASAHPKQSGTGRAAASHGLTMTSSPIANGANMNGSVSNGSVVNGRAATNGVANGHSAPSSNELAVNDSSVARSEKNGHAANGAGASGREAMVQEEFLFAQPEAVQDEAVHQEARTSSDSPRGDGVRRRAVRIVKVTDAALSPGNREQQLLDRLVRSEGRGAISRAANDLWESKFVAPKRQEIQIQLLEHENEHRARDAVFAMAELLQRESPIKRPVLDQRLRRLEQSAEDPITRDAAGALRRSMRVHHGA